MEQETNMMIKTEKQENPAGQPNLTKTKVAMDMH
jgi:hypothetical protein